MTLDFVPPGRQQFCDQLGRPLASGTVAFYQPGTFTPADTWQDPDGTALNTNPVTLDAAGRLTAYGSGRYRQIVNDVNGVQIWDQVVELPSGDALTLPLVPTFNAADFGVKADGVTDDTAAWLAALSKLRTLGGGRILAPLGTSIISQTLLLDFDGAQIIGSGRGAYHDVAPLAPAASTLQWGGPDQGVMVRAGPDVGGTGSGITDWAVLGLHLLSGVYPYTTAAGTGLEIVSASHGEADVFCSEFKTQGVIVHTLAGLTESQNSEKNRISIRARQINTAGCILRLNGNGLGTTNTCFNDFPLVAGEYSSAIAVDLHDCDNNDFHRLYLQPVGSSYGNPVVFNAGATTGGDAAARNNTIRHLSTSIVGTTVLALGTETAPYPSTANRVEQFDEANAFPTVQVGTGATLWWGTNATPPGVQSHNDSQYGGYRTAEDGFTIAWGTPSGQFGAGSTSQITFPAGVFKKYVTWVGVTAVGGEPNSYSVENITTTGCQIVAGSGASTELVMWRAEGF